MSALVNNFKRGEIANVLILHELHVTPSSLEQLVNYFVDLYKENGLTPTKMGITGEFYKTKKNLLYRNGLKNLISHAYEGVKGLSLYAHPPKHHTDMFDWLWVTSYYKSKYETFNFCWDDKMLPFSKACVEKIAKDIIDITNPKYGYFLQRNMSDGPNFYAYGVLAGDIPDQEEDEITEWGNSYNSDKYTLGDLRDVYPINILTQPHLERIVNGSRLQDWINALNQRGELEKLTNDVWIWSLSPEQIQPVREALRPSGLLISLNIT